MKSPSDLGGTLKLQMTVRASGPVLRYMRGQICLLDWLWAELGDAASPSYLLYARPNDLYRVLNAIGYVWEGRRRIWRLHRRLTRLRTLQSLQSLKNLPKLLAKMVQHGHGG